LVAVMSDVQIDLGVPCLHIDDIKGLTDLIVDRFLQPISK
jgi:hypothetical protein